MLMCGLAGYWDINNRFVTDSPEHIGEAMANAVRHRGPDSSGVWCDRNAGLVLGHQRLSIIDLTEAGHQPMISQSERWVIVYNGEIYNADELREALAAHGVRFRGHSDTEVILEACEWWGVEAATKRFIGMFAFALWDRRDRQLFLIRDRLGIKPFYFGFHHGILLFGSELKSFFAHPKWHPEIDRDALVSYFRYGYIPAPQSIYKEIYKLRPGHIAVIDAKGNVRDTAYWQMSDVAKQPLLSEKMNEEHIIVELDTLLRDAVKRRMVSDVPLGGFLSGGIDSSTVVALMQAQSKRPVQTFAIGFSESDYNEAKHAKSVANYLKTEHHELIVQPNDALDIIPELASWYDEPFADSSQIPTYLLAKMARQWVTVSLSGDGGDEVFAGYSRYVVSQAFWSRFRFMPSPLRRCLAKGINSLSPTQWSQIARCFPVRVRPTNVSEKVDKFVTMLRSNRDSYYQSIMSVWPNPDELVCGGQEVNQWNELSLHHGLIERMQYTDINTYLPDDILTKVDRASMSVGLEARVPLLDHRVVEFAWRLPMSMKVRGNVGKWILKRVLDRYVPKNLIDRPKMGFGVPIDQWLRGPLRPWAEALLDKKSFDEHGIMNTDPVYARWKAHCDGRRNFRYSIWAVLMFQAWYQRWMN